MSTHGLTLAELQARLGGELRGDASVYLRSAAALERAGPDQLSFALGGRHLDTARRSAAGALIIGIELADQLAGRSCLVVTHPHAAFARAVDLLHPQPEAEPGVHPGAVIHATARIAPGASIGPGCVVGADAEIGPRSRIGANCVIGAGARVGEDCRFHANVTLYDHCILGDRVILHAGCVIGSDGFGNALEDGHWVKVPQIGRVVIGNDVEIGANTTVDRGALEDTVIEDGVRIDNLVQIAHNCIIGAHTAIAGCAGIAGSTRVGRHCMIGGAAMILGHIELCDGVIVSGASFIGKSIRAPGVYTSTQPQMPHDEWLRNAAQLRHLADMRSRIRALERQVSEVRHPASAHAADPNPEP